MSLKPKYVYIPDPSSEDELYSRFTSESNYKEREKINVKVRKLCAEQDELMKR